MWTSYDKWFCRESKVHLSCAWYFLHPELLHKEGPGHTVTGMEKHLDVKITLRRINLQRNAVKRNTTASTTDTSVTKLSGKATIEVGRSEQMLREMDKLASEDHTYKATKEEIDVYRGTWWIHTNVAHFDSVPKRYQPDCKKALSTMHRLKQAGGRKETCHMVTQFLLFFLAMACKLVGVRFWVLASKMVWPPMARGNLFLGGSICICGKSLNVQKNFRIFTVNKSVTADGSLLSPTGV